MVDTESRGAFDGAPGASPPIVRTRWDGNDSPSFAVVRAVASASDTNPTALPPLQETVDTDALDSLATGRGPDSEGWSRVSFAYAGFEVVVGSEGIVEVRPVHSN